jgi:hypothetical protein
VITNKDLEAAVARLNRAAETIRVPRRFSHTNGSKSLGTSYVLYDHQTNFGQATQHRMGATRTEAYVYLAAFLTALRLTGRVVAEKAAAPASHPTASDWLTPVPEDYFLTDEDKAMRGPVRQATPGEAVRSLGRSVFNK